MALPTPLQAFSGVPKNTASADKQTIIDGEKMTGARGAGSSRWRIWACKDVFGAAGRRDPAGAPTRSRTIRSSASCSMRHEQAAGHAAEGYALTTGQRGRVHRHFRSGRDEHDHPDRRREHGFHSYGRHHRPGRRERHRHGRFPGSRYRRRHLSGGQALVPRHPRAGHSARAGRGALHRTFRPSGTGGGGRHQDRADRRDVLFLAAAHDSAGLQPDHQGARSRAVRRGEAVRAVVPSGAVRRRRRGAFRRGRRSWSRSWRK